MTELFPSFLEAENIEEMIINYLVERPGVEVPLMQVVGAVAVDLADKMESADDSLYKQRASMIKIVLKVCRGLIKQKKLKRDKMKRALRINEALVQPLCLSY